MPRFNPPSAEELLGRLDDIIEQYAGRPDEYADMADSLPTDSVARGIALGASYFYAGTLSAYQNVRDTMRGDIP